MKPDIKWLDNPEVFRANVLPACSDHQFYQSREEMKEGKNSLSLSLNGTWQFLYSKNAKERPEEFYQSDYAERTFGNQSTLSHRNGRL